MKNLEGIKTWLPSLFLMAIIFAISSVPGKQINDAGLGNESYHVTGHFILFLFLCLAYYRGTKGILFSVMLTILYGLFDEYHQIFTPNRSAGIFDIYVNSAGAVIAGGILWKLYPLLPTKLKKLLIN